MQIIRMGLPLIDFRNIGSICFSKRRWGGFIGGICIFGEDFLQRFVIFLFFCVKTLKSRGLIIQFELPICSNTICGGGMCVFVFCANQEGLSHIFMEGCVILFLVSNPKIYRNNCRVGQDSKWVNPFDLVQVDSSPGRRGK